MRSALRITGGTGLTSCLSVRLDQVCKYRHANGHWPGAVDGSGQFDLYRSDRITDMDATLLAPYFPPPFGHMDPVFDHGHQYAWYDELPIGALEEVASYVCHPSASVKDRTMSIAIAMGGRTAVLYRGNDKAKEVAPVPYDMMIDAARQSGSDAFWVQTDEQEFLDAFRAAFPNTLAIDTLPRIQRNGDAYVLPTPRKRPAFAIEFLAALFAIAHAPQVITTTGNTGLWAMIYRGYTDGVWQAHGQHQQVRKLFTE